MRYRGWCDEMKGTSGQMATAMKHKGTDQNRKQKVKLTPMSFQKVAVLRRQYNAEKPWWRRSAMGFLFSILVVALVILGTLFLRSIMPNFRFPSALLLLAVLFVSLIWGVGPSLFALLLSTLALDYYFIPPLGVLKVYTPDGMLQFIPFALAGLVIALITAQRESARIKILEAEQQLQERAEDLEETNRRLEETNQKLKEANQLKDRFISIASHELKTPITTIRGQAQLVLRRLSKQNGSISPEMATMRTTLEKINDQTGRLTALVDELLEISSLRSGKAELRKKECDLVEICRGVIEDQQLLSGREITLTVAAERVAMLVDCDRIAQVMVNLVGNAIKYSPEHSPVEVDVSSKQGNALIQVRDHGKGIARDQQEHIFETFYRTPDAQSSAKFGLGLGLAISKDIVERHGGSIWCESQVGKGSTFFVNLPLK